MNYFEFSYTAIGGLALFFLGLRYLSESLQTLAGGLVHRAINYATSNRFIAVIVGLVVTTIVQSSSVSTVMVVGLVNAGLMNLAQAIGVIFGANIGTTVTGWILVIKIGKYGLLLLALGIFPMLFFKNERFAYSGRLLVALGLIFYGLQIMSGAFKPLRTDPNFISYLQLFDASTTLSMLGCVLIGCLLTFVIQSSSAMLGITIALASTGAIGFPTAAALVFGENVGTTITAMLASIGANTSAKRAALSHATFNIIGVVVLLIIFNPYLEFIDSIVSGNPELTTADGTKPNIASHIAMGHTVFNCVATLVALPFIGLLVKFVSFVIPEKEGQSTGLKYIGTSGLVDSTIALSTGKLEILELAKRTREILVLSEEYIKEPKHNGKILDRIRQLEAETDQTQQGITSFVCQVMEGSLSEEQSSEAYFLIRGADELESIADYAESLASYKYRLHKNEYDFSEVAWEELYEFLIRNLNLFDLVVQDLAGESHSSFENIKEKANSLNRHADDIKIKHLSRMNDGSCKARPALTYSDMMVALRRIKNHTVNLFESYGR